MRSATVLLSLALAATAHAKSFDDDLPAVSSAIGGAPEVLVLVQRSVGGYFVGLRMAYRAGVFSLLNGRPEVRYRMRCDEIEWVDVQLGRIWDSVGIRTTTDLTLLRVINVRGREDDVHKMLATLKACAEKRR